MRRLAPAAQIGVRRCCVEVHRIPSLQVMRHLRMPQVQLARKHIQKLKSRMLVRLRLTPSLRRQELRKVRMEPAIRHQVPQTLKKVVGILYTRLRFSHPVLRPVNPKRGLRLRLEKVAQILRKHHGNPRQVSQRRHHPARLQLRQKARRKSRVPPQLHQPHPLLQPQVLDPLPNPLLRDKCLSRLALHLNVRRLDILHRVFRGTRRQLPMFLFHLRRHLPRPTEMPVFRCLLHRCHKIVSRLSTDVVSTSKGFIGKHFLGWVR